MREKIAFLFVLLSLFSFSQSKVNIIHIIADDIAYDDLSSFGAKTIKTPHLDQLAKEGMRFSNFYAPHPTCTPSRAALLTGRYSPRINDNKGLSILWPRTNDGLDPKKEVTLTELLKEKGYTTALIGKWHLGYKKEFMPLAHGFDVFYGIPHPNDHGPERDWNMGTHNLPPIPLIEGNDLIDELENYELAEMPAKFTRRACKFIREKAKSKEPFYLQYSNIETHTPWFVPMGFSGISEAGEYGDAVEYLDRSIGTIIRQLKESNLLENTLIIFTADNGALAHRYPELEEGYGKYAMVDEAMANNRMFRDGKYQSRYEGGAHVPCIIKWKGTIPENTVNDLIIDGTDLFTTLLTLADATIPTDRIIDGKNIVPLLKGTSTEPVRNTFYAFGPKSVLMSVRFHDWKLVIPSPAGWDWPVVTQHELYDLSKDPKEQYNIAHKHPEIVEKMTQLAEQAKKDVISNTALKTLN